MLLALTVSSPVASAVTLTVCVGGACSHDTLAGAVAAYAAGDTIEVQAGTWVIDTELSVDRDLTILSTPVGAATLAPTVALSAAFEVQDATFVMDGFVMDTFETPLALMQDVDATFRNLTVSNGDLGTQPFLSAFTSGKLPGSVRIEDSTFDTLTADLLPGVCGVVRAWSSTVLEVERVTVTDTRSAAGAICGEGPMTVTDSTFVGNRADYGGALWHGGFGNQAFSVSGSLFEDNEALVDGGGAIKVYQRAGPTTIDRCTFVGNDANTDGGAIDIHTGGSGSLVVTESTFEGNTATRFGGAIAVGFVGTDLDLVDVERTVFCGNAAGLGGGALALDFVDAVDLGASAFVDNRGGTHGGAVYLYQASGGLAAGVTNVDFLHNSATYGGALFTHTYSAAVTNSLFVGHDDPVLSTDYGVIGASYSGLWDNDGTFGVPTDAEDVAADPLLVMAGPTSCDLYDLRPMAGSPLIDAGDPAILDADSTASDIGMYGGPDAWEDGDSDGWYDDVDCGTADGAVYPGAPELCDGSDNDCDGAVDEGLGDPVEVCNQLDDDCDGEVDEGFVTGPETCNQLDDNCDGAVDEGFVTGPEACNGLDDDCDGAVDEDLASNLGYLDGDGDGFGAGEAVGSCEPLATGWTTVSGDCDDARAGVYPDAPEISNDGRDQDCDGSDLQSTLGGSCACSAGGADGVWLAGVLLAGARVRRRTGTGRAPAR